MGLVEALPRPALPHARLCCAGSDVVEWLAHKYCVSDEGKGVSPLLVLPPALGSLR